MYLFGVLQLFENKCQIDKLCFVKDFYEQLAPKTVHSDPVEFINGFPWQIMIKDCDEYVGLHLHCDGDETARRVGQLFHANSQNVKDLMGPKNGLYDENEEAVMFKAEVVADKPNGMLRRCFILLFSKLCFLGKTPKKRQKVKLTKFRTLSVSYPVITFIAQQLLITIIRLVTNCPCPIVRAKLSVPNCPCPIVRAQLSVPNCPCPIVRAQLSVPNCPCPIVRAQLSEFLCCQKE
uniref:MATH domain-containing protein n=1 Tax=Globodera rostochiensis TaxID=31243 RepID=A0A914GT90_GLORO